MIVFLTILSLVSGLVYGYFDVESSFISAITQNTHIVLYILMFSVGISIGMYDGIVQKIREYHIKIFIIPIGIIIGSLLGGIICSMIVKMPVGHGTAIASGLGWYSLSGATISKLVSAEAGSIAFLSNLIFFQKILFFKKNKIFSFFIIPFLAVHFNYYTCIAPAGATSEDTTLPVMLKYTNEETVVLSVLNGVICSFCVPILISFCLNIK